MAGTSLLVLIDDIAAVLDDVALMSKVAARKAAGVLGDDLALNANQVVGVRADRELPVVWAVAKGSFRNKLILVPAALVISVIAPWLVTPLLMLGGLYLCFEGVEKLAHPLLHSAKEDEQHHRELVEALADPAVDPREFERSRVRGAIRTDFILSAEIIVLTLGIVAASPFSTQILVLAGIAIAMTVGVYGLVAGIVKLDDAGLYLLQREGDDFGARVARWWGQRLLDFAPILMKILSVVGTAAMFLVGGGILLHGFHALDVQVQGWAERAAALEVGGRILAVSIPPIAGVVLGLVAGSVVLAVVKGVERLRT